MNEFFLFFNMIGVYCFFFIIFKFYYVGFLLVLIDFKVRGRRLEDRKIEGWDV